MGQKDDGKKDSDIPEQGAVSYDGGYKRTIGNRFAKGNRGGNGRPKGGTTVRAVVQAIGRGEDVDALVAKIIDQAMAETKVGDATKLLMATYFPKARVEAPKGPAEFNRVGRLTNMETALAYEAELIELVARGADVEWGERVLKMVRGWIEDRCKVVEIEELRAEIERIRETSSDMLMLPADL